MPAISGIVVGSQPCRVVQVPCRTYWTSASTLQEVAVRCMGELKCDLLTADGHRLRLERVSAIEAKRTANSDELRVRLL